MLRGSLKAVNDCGVFTSARAAGVKEGVVMRSYGEWWAVAGRGGLVPAIVAGTFLCLLSVGCHRGSHAPKSSHVAECRISYFWRRGWDFRGGVLE